MINITIMEIVSVWLFFQEFGPDSADPFTERDESVRWNPIGFFPKVEAVEGGAVGQKCPS